MRTGKRVTIVSFVSNIILTALKFVAGGIFFNMAMLSDAAQSGIDTMATGLILIATVISKPAPDKKHSYGREKREQIIVLFFSLFMFATTIFLLYEGIRGLTDIQSTAGRSNAMFIVLVAVAALSIIVKELLYQYTIRCYRKTGLTAVRADAWGHRSDMVSSLAVLVGVVCSYFIGYDTIESIAIIIVALFVLLVAIRILKGSYNQLVDKSASDADCQKIRTHASKVPGVECIDEMQTRMYGNAVIVDIEIGVDETLSVAEANEIIERVEDEVEDIPDVLVKDCNVHINPVKVKKPRNEVKAEKRESKRMRRKEKLEQKLSKVRD